MEPSGLCPWQGLVQGCPGDSGMGSVLEQGRISSLEPSPGGKGSSAVRRGREGEAGWTRPPAPGIWGLELPGQALKGKMGELFQSLWIIHRGVK